MSEQQPLRLTPELIGAVTAAAAFRGMSPGQYVQEVVAVATRLDAELAADLKEADEDFESGRFYTQEQVEAMFNVQREQRSAA